MNPNLWLIAGLLLLVAAVLGTLWWAAWAGRNWPAPAIFRTADGGILSADAQRALAEANKTAYASAPPPRPAERKVVPIITPNRKEIAALKASAHAAVAELLTSGRVIGNPHKVGTRRAVVWETFYLDAVMTADSPAAAPVRA